MASTKQETDSKKSSKPRLPEPPDGEKQKETWIVLEGVESDDFEDNGAERLQQRILEYLLLETSVPVTGVKLVETDT